MAGDDCQRLAFIIIGQSDRLDTKPLNVVHFLCTLV